MKVLTKWSVEDYHRMIEAGILRDRPVELLQGEIVEMSPETPLHYTTAKQGAKYLEEVLTGVADVRLNGPITLADSEPEPDIAVVRLSATTYSQRHPTPADIFWVIEVARSSLKQDLEAKAAIYANALIPEYWVVDLAGGQVIVFRHPEGGRYQEQQQLAQGTLTPLAFPDRMIAIARLFVQVR
jgi:Uma2 family endonuclease